MQPPVAAPHPLRPPGLVSGVAASKSKPSMSRAHPITVIFVLSFKEKSSLCHCRGPTRADHDATLSPLGPCLASLGGSELTCCHPVCWARVIQCQMWSWGGSGVSLLLSRRERACPMAPPAAVQPALEGFGAESPQLQAPGANTTAKPTELGAAPEKRPPCGRVAQAGLCTQVQSCGTLSFRASPGLLAH